MESSSGEDEFEEVVVRKKKQKKPDGRSKAERSEAQKAATKRMLEARKEKRKGKLTISKNYDPDNIAIAELWYSNHELAKKQRREKKMKEMEELITKKLDSYHSKLMDDLEKPLNSYLDKYIDVNFDDEEENIPEKKLTSEKPPEEPAEEEPAEEPAGKPTEEEEEEEELFREPRRPRNFSLRPPRNRGESTDWSYFF
jgi:hypothetical protein